MTQIITSAESKTFIPKTAGLTKEAIVSWFEVAGVDTTPDCLTDEMCQRFVDELHEQDYLRPMDPDFEDDVIDDRREMILELAQEFGLTG